MKRALLNSPLLMGDGLYVGPVVKRWFETKGKEFDEVHLTTVPNHAADIYKYMGLPWKIVSEKDKEPYDYEHTFNAWDALRLISDKRKCHLIHSYGELMGVDTTGIPLVPIFEPPDWEVPEHLKGRILVSMMSYSDPINKVPRKWSDWTILLNTLREAYPGAKLGVLGAKTERVPEELGIKDDEYLLGLPLVETAHVMRHCKCVVTVDNGMAHLAASQKVRQFYLAAWCLNLYFIVGWGNPNLRIWHFNPMTADMNVVNEALQSAILDWAVMN